MKKKLDKRKTAVRLLFMIIGILAARIAGEFIVQALTPQNVREARAAFERGEAAEKNKDDNTAFAHYSQAISLDPNKDRYYYSRALIYRYNKKDYGKAIEDFTESIRVRTEVMKRKPLSSQYSSRGECYFEIGDYVKAMADYTEAINVAPEKDKTLKLLQRAAFYSKTRDYKWAIEDYTEVIKRARKPNATLYYLRGRVYYDRGRYPDAVTDFETALRLDPNDLATQSSLEDARRASGR